MEIVKINLTATSTGPSAFQWTLDFDEIIPVHFISHFYVAINRYPFYLIPDALYLQFFLSIPTILLLIIYLKFSQELRDFCGFVKNPSDSKFTHFKQNFLLSLQPLFNCFVELPEPIGLQIPWILYKAAYFPMPALQSNRWISRSIFVISINSISLPVSLTLSLIFFYNKAFLDVAPDIAIEKKPNFSMKINHLQIHKL